MLNRLSHKMTCFFIRKNAIKEADKEIYDYCFEILLSTLLNLFSIILIAICTKTYLTSLIFVIVFMIMRASSGGYHAEKHIRCFVILMIVYSGMILSVKFVDNFLIYGTVLNSISLVLYPIIAPVEHPNNPMDKTKKRRLRFKSNILSAIVIAVNIPILHFDNIDILGFTLAYANTCVAVSCLCAVIKNYIKRQKNALQGA